VVFHLEHKHLVLDIVLIWDQLYPGSIPCIIWTHEKAEIINAQYLSLSAMSQSNREGFLVTPNINNTQDIIAEAELLSKSIAQSPGLAERRSVMHPF